MGFTLSLTFTCITFTILSKYHQKTVFKVTFRHVTDSKVQIREDKPHCMCYRNSILFTIGQFAIFSDRHGLLLDVVLSEES